MDGKSILYGALSVGNNSVVVVYDGDVNYTGSKNSAILYVDSITSEVTVNVTSNGTDSIIEIDVPEGQTGYVTISVNGTNITAPIVDGKAIFNVTGLDISNGTAINITYRGNLIPNINATVTNNSYSDTTKLVIDVSNNANGVVNVTVDGKVFNGTVVDGHVIVDLTGLSAGVKEAVVDFIGTNGYGNVTQRVRFAIDKANTGLDIKQSDKDVIAYVNSNAKGNIILYINGMEYNAPIVNGKVILSNVLDIGNNSVIAVYGGDTNYNGVSNSTNINIPKVSDYKIDVNTNVNRDKVTIDVALPSDINGVVLINVDDDGYYANVTNGKASIELTYPNNGVHNVSVEYSGDNKYGSAKNTTKFIIDYKKPSSLNMLIDNNTIGKPLSVVVLVEQDATGVIVLEIDGKNYTSGINGGVSEFTIADLNEGNYNIKATYDGDNKYDPSITNGKTSISKIKDYDIDVKQAGKNITVSLPKDAEGMVNVIIDGVKFTGNIVNGTITINPYLALGSHNISIIYDGDNKYSSNEFHSEINLINGIIITAPVLVKYYSSPERFYVHLEDYNGDDVVNTTVSITINDVTYNRVTDEHGVASLAVNLDAGSYPVFVSVNDNNNEIYNNTISSAVIVNHTIYANDIVKVYKNGTQFYALFLDANGKPLMNTNISFNINGVFYNRTTNASGWARLNINLDKGVYVLTSINTVTGELKSNIVQVISKIVENNNLIKYYHNDSQFRARILGNDGNPVGAGKEVKFNIHGVFYTRYTDEDGYVNLNINLGPGDYIMTTYYEDCCESNHVHVLPVLFTEDLLMKYNDGSKFVAHLLDGKGNPYANQIVKFNINGVIYERTTDNLGNANLSINLQRGQYIITSTYIGESNSNTIVIY